MRTCAHYAQHKRGTPFGLFVSVGIVVTLHVQFTRGAGHHAAAQLAVLLLYGVNIDVLEVVQVVLALEAVPARLEKVVRDLHAVCTLRERVA